MSRVLAGGEIGASRAFRFREDVSQPREHLGVAVHGLRAGTRGSRARTAYSLLHLVQRLVDADSLVLNAALPAGVIVGSHALAVELDAASAAAMLGDPVAFYLAPSTHKARGLLDRLLA